MNNVICRSSCIVFIIALLSSIPCSQSASKRRFTIVSDSIIAQNFYPRLQHTKPFHNEPDIDFNTKNQICEDITRSYYFRKSGIFPRERPGPTITSRYFGRPKWTYPVETIQVWLPLQKMTLDESVFVCLARKTNRHYKYYISEEYHLDADDDLILGRFIFYGLIGERKSLFGLAESTADIFVHPDYAVEDIYLQRRAKYKIAWKDQFDSLCGLSDEDRLRVCLAVFRSTNYFAQMIPVSDLADEIKGICGLQTVSFQTEQGATGAVKRKFRERMLTCETRSEPDTSNRRENPYMLSQAYHSNQVILYKQDQASGHIFPEILLTNVRLVFNSENHGKPADDERVAEDLTTYNQVIRLPSRYLYSQRF